MALDRGRSKRDQHPFDLVRLEGTGSLQATQGEEDFMTQRPRPWVRSGWRTRLRTR